MHAFAPRKAGGYSPSQFGVAAALAGIRQSCQQFIAFHPLRPRKLLFAATAAGDGTAFVELYGFHLQLCLANVCYRLCIVDLRK